MAIFRKVHTQIWSDPFFSELNSEKKIFYLYLLTNERTKQCGIYEISKRHIAFDLSITIKSVTDMLTFFNSKGKLKYSEATNEIAVKNWAKYNYSTSPKVVKCIESELKVVKNRVLIEYIYSIDTLSQEEQEEEEEQEQEQEKFNFRKSLIELGASENLVVDWLQVRKNKKASNTQTAFNSFRKELEKSNLNIDKILETCITRDWKGFQSEWITNLSNNGNGKSKQQLFNEDAEQWIEELRSNGQPHENVDSGKFDDYSEL
jgi:hypothetical protein